MQITKDPTLTKEQMGWLDRATSTIPDELHWNDEVLTDMYDVDGKLYVIFYRRDLSNWDYTKHFIYDVLTQEESWGKCQKGIAACLNDESMTIGQYRALNDASPSILNYLNKHHKMENIEGTDVMRYTIIVPYDD